MRLDQLQTHLSANNLREIRQSAYIKNHGSETTVLRVLDNLITFSTELMKCLCQCWLSSIWALLLTLLTMPFSWKGSNLHLRFLALYLTALPLTYLVENSRLPLKMPCLPAVLWGMECHRGRCWDQSCLRCILCFSLMLFSRIIVITTNMQMIPVRLIELLVFTVSFCPNQHSDLCWRYYLVNEKQ